MSPAKTTEEITVRQETPAVTAWTTSLYLSVPSVTTDAVFHALLSRPR